MRGSSVYLLVFVVGAVALWAANSFWSRDARLERRRRKSHSRIVAKGHGPSVRFSVRAPKKK